MGEPPNSGPAMGKQSPTNEPLPYKIYTTLGPIELPRDFPGFTTPARLARGEAECHDGLNRTKSAYSRLRIPGRQHASR